MTSRPYAEVIGDPIGHSKSPLIHGFWLEKLAIEADYRAVRVPLDGIGDYFTARRADPAWLGCNVTMPHKRAIAPFVDRVEWAAREISAINCVHRVAPGHHDLAGDNFDAEGFSRALDEMGSEGGDVAPLAGKRAVLLGGGGAARAVRLALGDHYQALGEVVLVSRVRPDFLGPDDRWYGWADRADAIDGADLLVNSTPLGMTGFDPLEVDCGRMAAGAMVSDLVYAPVDTPLLRQARAHGLRAVDGLGMLIHQAALGFERFFGQTAPLEQHADELRALLVA
ncbi:shikimate dehydrogenase [Sphingomonas sp.]|uniref:shikimate dehydrogenase family protein n=1 Tax=Sphingomonas sp. TaxID=28214 RepID=UPI00286C8D67|nr:shikimate dehydrogenase [Sphingomonas sp.]